MEGTGAVAVVPTSLFKTRIVALVRIGAGDVPLVCCRHSVVPFLYEFDRSPCTHAIRCLVWMANPAILPHLICQSSAGAVGTWVKTRIDDLRPVIDTLDSDQGMPDGITQSRLGEIQASSRFFYILQNEGRIIDGSMDFLYIFRPEVSGEVAEWLKALVSKTSIPHTWDRGFESLPLRSPLQRPNPQSTVRTTRFSIFHSPTTLSISSQRCLASFVGFPVDIPGSISYN